MSEDSRGGRLILSGAPRWVRHMVIFALGIGAIEVLDHLVFPQAVPNGEVVYGGAVLGTVYALLAIGLILVYQSNHIINFAVAEFGVFGAIFYQNLLGQSKVPWVVALAAGIAAAGIAGWIMERFLARRFAESSRLILTVATIGMSQFVAFGEIEVSQHFGTPPAAAGLRTPLSGFHFTIGGVKFDGNVILLVAVTIAIIVVLELFLHRTAYGIALRASAENASRASLLGVPVKTVSTIAWVLAALIAGIATILQSPMTGVVAGGTVIGPTLLYKSLTVAVIADFSDLPAAVMGGVFLGALEQSINYAYSNSTVTDAIYVAITIVILLCRRQRVGRIVEGAASSWRSIREVRRVPRATAHVARVRAVRWGAVLVGAALLVLGPLGLGGAGQFDLSEVVLFGMIAVSTVVVTGWSGQISLGQFAIAAVGAVVAGKLFSELHWDFFISMVAGGAAGAVTAAVLGAVATRVRGFMFAVTSLGFAVALESYFLNPHFFPWIIPTEGFINLNEPVLFGHISLNGDLAYYYLCLIVLVLVGLSVSALRRSRTGRVLIATKDNDRAAYSYGVSHARSLLSSFAISGFIAGIAGCLFAFHAGAVDPGDYAASQSILVFSMAVIGGLGSVPSAVIGAAIIEGWGFLFAQNQALEYLGTAAGLTIVLLIIPEGIGSLLYRLRDVLLGPYAPEKLAGVRRSAKPPDVEVSAPGDWTSATPIPAAIPAAIASGIASGIPPGDPRLADAPPPPPLDASAPAPFAEDAVR